ncbi:uncharacterized protein BJX67DRAFT_41573 [Aspergillus lucknowensis]|uniref:Uncharacterized protein n=1 Tax=Aspergillus lucknowensis TaxID=176173 RepID=A0ABR4LVF9_9EURO
MAFNGMSVPCSVPDRNPFKGSRLRYHPRFELTWKWGNPVCSEPQNYSLPSSRPHFDDKPKPGMYCARAEGNLTRRLTNPMSSMGFDPYHSGSKRARLIRLARQTATKLMHRGRRCLNCGKAGDGQYCIHS